MDPIACSASFRPARTSEWWPRPPPSASCPLFIVLANRKNFYSIYMERSRSSSERRTQQRYVSCAGLLSARRQGCRHKSLYATVVCSLFVFEATAVAAFSITQHLSPCSSLPRPALPLGTPYTPYWPVAGRAHTPMEPHLSRLTKKSLTILISVCKFHAI